MADLPVVSLLSSVEEFVRVFLEKENLSEQSNVLCKLSNSAKSSGEIFSSVKCLAKSVRESPDHRVKHAELQLSAESLRASCEKWSQLFNKVVLHPQPGLIYLTLNRTSATRQALGYALKGLGGVSIGRGREQQCVTVWAFVGGTTKIGVDTVVTSCEASESRGQYVSKSDSVGSSYNILASMEVARLLIGAAVLTRVLLRTSHKVVLPSQWTDMLKDVKEICPHLHAILHSLLGDIQELRRPFSVNDTVPHAVFPTATFLSQLTCSSYSVPVLEGACAKDHEQSSQTSYNATSSATTGQPSPTPGSHSALMTDLQRFLSDHNLAGKGGFSKNIRTVQVCTGRELTTIGKISCQIFEELNSLGLGENAQLLVATTQRQSFLTEQVVATALLANCKSPCGWSPKLLLSGEVYCYLDDQEESSDLSFSDYYQTRLTEMQQACRIKYGDMFEGMKVDKIAQTMAEAVIKFELLSVDPKHQLSLDLPFLSEESVLTSNMRYDGAFVLYNYARLATLQLHYQREVNSGKYPPLPSLEQIDFSLLKEEEEWQLVCTYVLQFPRLLCEAGLLSGKGLRVDSNVRKLCQFLTRLSHAFSTYYGRVKILLSPQPHLLPLIHARMTLVAGLKEVVHCGLALLGIQPLNQL